jgi:hypothetical protein
MRTEEIKVYTFEELDERAKEKARERKLLIGLNLNGKIGKNFAILQVWHMIAI